MLTIRNSAELARALDSPIDTDLKRLLALRREQLAGYADHDFSELACFIVAETGDSIARIEAEAGCPIITSPAFEWVCRHDGWYEAPTIVSDDGFGIVLFAPAFGNIDPIILSTMRQGAIGGAAKDCLPVKEE